MKKRDRCFARHHIHPPAAVAFYEWALVLSRKSGVFYGDEEGYGVEWSVDRGTIRGWMKAISGFLKVIRKHGRNRLGIAQCGIYRVLSHDEWAAEHPGQCWYRVGTEKRPIVNSPQGMDSEQILEGQIIEVAAKKVSPRGENVNPVHGGFSTTTMGEFPHSPWGNFPHKRELKNRKRGEDRDQSKKRFDPRAHSATSPANDNIPEPLDAEPDAGEMEELENSYEPAPKSHVYIRCSKCGQIHDAEYRCEPKSQI